jgi:hypothetical protein
MSDNTAVERISYLAEKFNVFTKEDSIMMTSGNLNNKYHGVYDKSVIDINILALYTLKTVDDLPIFRDDNPIVNWVGVSVDVFNNMVMADPTKNKIYVQWMLTTFTRYIKDNDLPHAIRFGCEDLPLASEYLDLFHKNKNKKIFTQLCKSNLSINKIKNHSDINQYKSLSQVFDSVDPYITRNMSELESQMNRFVKLNQAEIPFKDRNFTLYIPKTRESSVIFNNFVGWCTAKKENSNFTSYRKQHNGFGVDSDLFIIINHKLFLGEDNPEYRNELWQFHFESNQLMDKSNSTEHSIRDKILDKSDGLNNFFYEHLINNARAMGSGSDLKNNRYVKALISFGFSDILFEVLDPNTQAISLINEKISRLPDVSRFTELRSLYLRGSGLSSIDDSIGTLKNLSILSLPNNNLTTIPLGFCLLKKLTMLNLVGNKIKYVPNEISKLDKSNGGSLTRLSLGKLDISSDLVDKLKQLLPNTEIIVFETE